MIDLSLMTKQSLAKVFDYSVLPKETQEAGIRKGCALTRQYQFAAFYSASPFWAPVIKEELADYPEIEIGTGIAFPWGAVPPSVKAFETEEAVKLGCTAVDICVNVGALKDKRLDIVREELQLFVKAAGPAVTKCIIETCFLSDEDIRNVCNLIAETGVMYAKTSSGQFEGPTLEQFMVMRRTLEGTDVKLKVAGVKFPRPQNAYVFLLAGADRIGTRDAPAIIDSLDLLREIGMLPQYRLVG
ncbi:MAG: deoxyribose-phosphate aldolase [Anaerolineales bacterium]|nr:deoxyribose-phosphate aldolase [Anaerolineales bacterium]